MSNALIRCACTFKLTLYTFLLHHVGWTCPLHASVVHLSVLLGHLVGKIQASFDKSNSYTQTCVAHVVPLKCPLHAPVSLCFPPQSYTDDDVLHRLGDMLLPLASGVVEDHLLRPQRIGRQRQNRLCTERSATSDACNVALIPAYHVGAAVVALVTLNYHYKRAT